jgi:hypothetical protein
LPLQRRLFKIAGMAIALTCPQCARRHQAPESLAGKQVKCACGAVLAIPAAAPAAAAPKRPSGSWGQAAPAPAAAASGSSVFDDISQADVIRHKPAQVVLEPAATASPMLSAVAGNTSQILLRAQQQLQEKDQEEAAKLPFSASMSIACLAVPGVVAFIPAFISLMALGTEFVEEFGSIFLIFIFLVCSLQGILNVGTAVLIYIRAPFARPLGYFTGIVTLVTSCVNPVGFFCSIIALWFLSQSETGDYLSRKGALGVIDW